MSRLAGVDPLEGLMLGWLFELEQTIISQLASIATLYFPLFGAAIIIRILSIEGGRGGVAQTSLDEILERDEKIRVMAIAGFFFALVLIEHSVRALLLEHMSFEAALLAQTLIPLSLAVLSAITSNVPALLLLSIANSFIFNVACVALGGLWVGGLAAGLLAVLTLAFTGITPNPVRSLAILVHLYLSSLAPSLSLIVLALLALARRPARAAGARGRASPMPPTTLPHSPPRSTPRPPVQAPQHRTVRVRVSGCGVDGVAAAPPRLDALARSLGLCSPGRRASTAFITGHGYVADPCRSSLELQEGSTVIFTC